MFFIPGYSLGDNSNWIPPKNTINDLKIDFYVDSILFELFYVSTMKKYLMSLGRRFRVAYMNSVVL